jgi:peptidoglycan/xylan/chitin deacetylase (PgdA/CDA1 family)
MRVIFVPQGTIVLAALLLVYCAFYPQNALPIVASRSAHDFITPGQRTFHIPAIGQLRYHGPKTKGAFTRQDVPPPKFIPSVDCESRPCIALTFDDGPDALTTPRVLDVLEQRQVPATFFLIGRNIGGNEGLVRRMATDKFEIGNHTWDHAHLPTLTRELINDEVLRTQTAIAAAGAPVPALLRPPYGEMSPDVLQNIGLQLALWNEDPKDWEATDPAALTQTVVAAARPGGVIDFHDTHPITADVMAGIIDQLSLRNFRFVTMSDLLHSRYRPGTAPFYGYAYP